MFAVPMECPNRNNFLYFMEKTDLAGGARERCQVNCSLRYSSLNNTYRDAICKNPTVL
jgi:hypothetical protein